MNDFVVWIIIMAFYAPLHYLMPVLFLFITGKETEEVRKKLIKGSLIDSTISMVLSFTIVIILVKQEMISLAMLVLLISIFSPFIRIIRHRREISGEEA